ncbi:hypothetical protein ACHAWU_007897, partial [Discostella pseudostelligera]
SSALSLQKTPRHSVVPTFSIEQKLSGGVVVEKWCQLPKAPFCDISRSRVWNHHGIEEGASSSQGSM